MKVKFAVIGTSKITKMFIEAAKQDQRFELHAVYSRGKETAQAFAKDHNAAHVFTDLSALGQCQEIDAVYIASPNSYHAQQAIQMMNAGKHVLCEKPIAVNSNEFQAMVTSAKQNNVCLMEAMLSSFVPNFLTIKNSLDKILPLRKFTASFCQYSSRYPAYLQGDNPNTFNLAFANGSLVDIGIYPLYAAISLFGEPDNVQSQCTKLASGVDGCGDVLLSYEKSWQLQAVISHSKVSSGENIGELQGENGRIVWQHSSEFNQVKLLLNDGEEQTLSVEQNSNKMVYECQHFLDLIAAKRIESPVNSWQLSLLVLQVLEQVRAQQSIVYPNDNV
ncbi:Gfo/Idh/MocA family protein [Thalassotalea castellviae]|uniref:Gfo/Idh/MocA family oxidoreductase n=1 Tax=Thalassotalea castellviae TaxID=3075612 RepID=A0ABU2ZXS3_9GAMM|nr:Gfo/Idh/MocA family oxidoreductase [Thalassotalea sp. W431]MDT0602721.1 Gfo/Idh/MocA family oxidoreductase [Thalassotalea sp. W431]